MLSDNSFSSPYHLVTIYKAKPSDFNSFYATWEKFLRKIKKPLQSWIIRNKAPMLKGTRDFIYDSSLPIGLYPLPKPTNLQSLRGTSAMAKENPLLCS